MISVNALALGLVREMEEDPDRFGAKVSRLANGATVVDVGLEAPGGWLAGKYYAEITMGTLGRVSFDRFDLMGVELPSVVTTIDNPLIACLACQMSGWPLESGEFSPVISGPGRTLAVGVDKYIHLHPYRDASQHAVVGLQMDRPVTEAMVQRIAADCSVREENVHVLLAPSGSLVGSIQVAARSVEQGMHKLWMEGFDLQRILSAWGYAPVAPPVRDELKAFGRINDCLVYGGVAVYLVMGDDDAIEAIVDRVVSKASPAYGRTFEEIYEDAGRDFWKIDPGLHSPAVVQIHNVASGKAYRAGEINYEVLRRSLLT
jgi:methenyltetrahydromethanopterin cyclohydrolase